jgi:hypothetical protein
MPSDAQIEANRRNAQKSTGPRTETGKAAASRNALRHGLASSQLILFGERQEDFDRFFGELRTAYGPEDAVEDGLVERIALAQWRLRRVWRAEAAALNEEALGIARGRAREIAAAQIAEELRQNPPGGTALTPDAVMDCAAAAAAALSNDALEEAMTPPESDGDEDREPDRPDTLVWPERMTHLSRYEGQIERMLGRATRELQRRQVERRFLALATAKAAAEQASLERRVAEAKATMARERAFNDKLGATAYVSPPGAPPPMTALTIAAMEAEIEIAKRREYCL